MNFMSNDYDALISRIEFVQRHESCSHRVFLWLFWMCNCMNM